MPMLSVKFKFLRTNLFAGLKQVPLNCYHVARVGL